MKYTIPYDDKITLPHIKKIDSIGINADNLHYDNKELAGEVIITGDYSLDNSDDIMEFKHDIPVSFLIDDASIIPQINISNFKYELIMGRGLQVMFDLDVILMEESEKEETIVERDDNQDLIDEEVKEMQEFQEKIDANLDKVLNNKETPVEEIVEEVQTEQDNLREEEEVQEEQENQEEFEEVKLSTNLESTMTSFDTGFIPRDNDKYTTYKIILLENEQTIDELLEARNLSKAFICKEYQFNNKIVLKIEDD